MPGAHKPIIDWQGRRIIAVPVVLLVIIMGLTLYLGLNARDAFEANSSRVINSHEVVETAQTLLLDVQDAEASRRGYLLTRDAHFLAAFRDAEGGIPAALQRLRRLVDGDAVRVGRVDRLAEAIRADRRSLPDPSAAPATAAAGDSGLERVRRSVDSVVAGERQLLDRRRVAYEAIRDRTFWAVLLAAVASMAGLAYSLSAMVRGTRMLERRMEERDLAQAAQRESDALYRTMFVNAADYLFVIDIPSPDRFVLADLNPALEAAIGRSAADLRGLDLDKAAPRETADLMRQHYRDIVEAGATLTYQDPIATVAGMRTWETTFAPVFDGGRVVRIVGCGRDVSERARAEEQIRRAQRMEAVGQLTGGVAHDFNNLLQVIHANLELLAPRLAGDQTAAQRLKSALHGADRAAQLTRQLLAFARRQPLEPKVVNLGRLIEDMSDLLVRSVGESIAIEVSVQPDLWNTLVDAAQVESAVLNLALNARDAMPRGGRLRLELANVDLTAADLGDLEDLTPGQYVRLTLTDTGVGMPPDVLSRVFEPFFTTKGEEKGTGLGLSMVYGFVKQSRGHVRITSEAGKGTAVQIYLPRSHLIEDRQVEAAPVEAEHGETVLVVEDDAAVRIAACAMLEDLGYRCLEAEDAQSALRLLEDGADVQLLFTDVVMPGPVSSVDLAVRARELNPALPILFTSGYTRSVIADQDRLGEVHLLNKPYGQDELAQKIQAAFRAVRRVVLVVEDDALVRMSALDMMEDLGFAAVGVHSAAEALEILRGPARVDVLFTDVGLPDMRGPDLARQASLLRPGLKVAFASGYAADGAATEGALWLSKPYDLRELSRALATLIGPHRRPAPRRQQTP